MKRSFKTHGLVLTISGESQRKSIALSCRMGFVDAPNSQILSKNTWRFNTSLDEHIQRHIQRSINTPDAHSFDLHFNGQGELSMGPCSADPQQDRVSTFPGKASYNYLVNTILSISTIKPSTVSRSKILLSSLRRLVVIDILGSMSALLQCKSCGHSS